MLCIRRLLFDILVNPPDELDIAAETVLGRKNFFLGHMCAELGDEGATWLIVPVLRHDEGADGETGKPRSQLSVVSS